MNILGFGKTTLPSVIKNPFTKEKVKIIHVWMEIDSKGRTSAHGVLKFSNGDTKGEQHYDADTFDEVVLKIKQTLDNF
jgi:hypothetical protein